jgi:4-hydroxy-tetrahydrodipicolinate synthase
MRTLSGSIVALVTPFDQHGAIDYAPYTDLLDWHLQSKTDGVVLLGTTGEAATIHPAERERLIQLAVERLKGHIPLIIGAGSNNTTHAVQMTRQACVLGADAVLQVTPYYNKPTQEGLYQHFRTIAEACDIPQILYNVPSRTGVDLHTDTVLRLSELENIVALKDATGDLSRVEPLASSHLILFSGDDATAMDFVRAGGHGVISVTANIFPVLMRQLMHFTINGQNKDALAIHARLEKLFDDLFIETNPTPVKWALAQQGRVQNHLRLPLLPLSVQFEATLMAALESVDISLLNSIK